MAGADLRLMTRDQTRPTRKRASPTAMTALQIGANCFALTWQVVRAAMACIASGSSFDAFWSPKAPEQYRPTGSRYPQAVPMVATASPTAVSMKRCLNIGPPVVGKVCAEHMSQHPCNLGGTCPLFQWRARTAQLCSGFSSIRSHPLTRKQRDFA
jgi:hypothetical protein